MIDIMKGTNDFIDNLSFLMDMKGLSQRQVASKLGISQSSISSWRQGFTPNGETCVKLAKLLDTTVEYLVTGEDSSNAKAQMPDDIRQIVVKLSELTPEEREPLKYLIFSQVEYWKTKR